MQKNFLGHPWNRLGFHAKMGLALHAKVGLFRFYIETQKRTTAGFSRPYNLEPDEPKV